MKISFLLLAAMAIILACSFIPSPTLLDRIKEAGAPEEHLYTVSGTLHPAGEITLSENTRVTVLWLVLSGGRDYIGYTFGEGKVDFKNRSFEVNFDEPPPSGAVNQIDDKVLGVGFVILTDSHEWDGEIPMEAYTSENILGISANHAVIYIDGDIETFSDPEWLDYFEYGYNVGEGVDLPEGLDEFRPVDPHSIQIIIDDFENMEFLNFFGA